MDVRGPPWRPRQAARDRAGVLLVAIEGDRVGHRTGGPGHPSGGPWPVRAGQRAPTDLQIGPARAGQAQSLGMHMPSARMPGQGATTTSRGRSPGGRWESSHASEDHAWPAGHQGRHGQGIPARGGGCGSGQLPGDHRPQRPRDGGPASGGGRRLHGADRVVRQVGVWHSPDLRPGGQPPPTVCELSGVRRRPVAWRRTQDAPQRRGQ